MDTKKLIGEYQTQLDKFKKQDGFFEPISTVLTTHLYIEFFINQLIEKHFKLKKKILDDHRSYSFSIKLDLIFEKELIPDWLYHNIRKLNDIRNKYSHRLHFDILNADLSFKFPDDQNEIENMNLLKGLDKRRKKHNRNHLILFHIPILTLFLFEAHIRRNNLL